MNAKVFTLVCFGDSVTKGTPYVAAQDAFPQLLGRRVGQRLAGSGMRCRVFGAGVGGENTVEGLARIQDDVVDHAPDLVTVEFGLNDLRYEPEKRVEPDAFAANLKLIVRKITHTGAGVILMTPNPVVDRWHGYFGMPYYEPWGGCNGAVAQYAAVVRAVAGEVEAPLCDVYQSFVNRAIAAEFRGETKDYRDLTSLGRYISVSDGVHPTAEGHELIAGGLYRLITDMLPRG